MAGTEYPVNARGVQQPVVNHCGLLQCHYSRSARILRLLGIALLFVVFAPEE